MNDYHAPPRPRSIVLLGPIPCQTCRIPVEWDGLGWLFKSTMLIHNTLTCPGKPWRRRR